MPITRFLQKRLASGEEYVKEVPLFDFTGGLKTSTTPLLIEDKFLSNCKNVFMSEGRLLERFGYTRFGNGLPLPSPIMGFHQFYNFDGTEYLCCFTTRDIYKYNTSTGYFDLITESAVICDCETAFTAEAGFTAATDTTYKRYGSKCAKITIPASTTGLGAWYDFGDTDLSGYTHIHLYVRANKNVAAGALKLNIDDTSGCASPLEAIDLPALVANVTKEIEIVIADPSALNHALSVGITVAVALAEETLLYIDQISAVNCLTATEEDQISCDSIYDSVSGYMMFVFTNGVDNIKKWIGTGNWADLGGTPNKCKFLRNFYHYLCLFNVEVTGAWQPQRMDWPVQGKPEDWTGSGSGNVALAATSDFLVGAEVIAGALTIFKEKSIAICNYIGGVDPFDIIEGKLIGPGALTRGSIQNLGDFTIHLSSDDVYKWDGFSCKGVGNNVIKHLLDTMNPGELNIVHSHIIDYLNLYLLFVAKVSAEEPNAVWVYNYKDEQYWYWEFNDTFISSGLFAQVDKLSIGMLLEKLGTYNIRIGSRALAKSYPLSLFGDADGYVYRADQSKTSDCGVAIPWFLDTKSFVFGQPHIFTRFVGLDVFCKCEGDVVVSTSNNDGSTFVVRETKTISNPYSEQAFFNKIDVTAQRLMFRIAGETLDQKFDMEGMVVKHIEKVNVVEEDE